MHGIFYGLLGQSKCLAAFTLTCVSTKLQFLVGLVQMASLVSRKLFYVLLIERFGLAFLGTLLESEYVFSIIGADTPLR